MCHQIRFTNNKTSSDKSFCLIDQSFFIVLHVITKKCDDITLLKAAVLVLTASPTMLRCTHTVYAPRTQHSLTHAPTRTSRTRTRNTH